MWGALPEKPGAWTSSGDRVPLVVLNPGVLILGMNHP